MASLRDDDELADDHEDHRSYGPPLPYDHATYEDQRCQNSEAQLESLLPGHAFASTRCTSRVAASQCRTPRSLDAAQPACWDSRERLLLVKGALSPLLHSASDAHRGEPTIRNCLESSVLVYGNHREYEGQGSQHSEEPKPPVPARLTVQPKPPGPVVITHSLIRFHKPLHAPVALRENTLGTGTAVVADDSRC